MANENDIDSLIKEYSLDENETETNETVRGKLAGEIQKRTDLLKSIVKEKYRDIVETSDAIKSMKSNLVQVEHSIRTLDKNISDFYARVRDQHSAVSRRCSRDTEKIPSESQRCEDDLVSELLVGKISAMWSSFDSGDLRESVAHLNELTGLLDANKEIISKSQSPVLRNLEISSLRARSMIKNHLWHKIKTAAPDQICIIGGSEQAELYNLSLSCTMDFLVEILFRDLSDMSYHAQVERYQTPAFFNSQTNEVEADQTDPKLITPSHVAIPKQISPELSKYLFKVCETINKIAGFKLNRSSMVDSLGMTIEQILQVYSRVAQLVDGLKAETKRKRALQLHYDLLYVRILLNTSKDVNLIERLDPEINELSHIYELMLDSIEYYMISSALHTNVIALSQSTIRLYGLLIPHLQ